MKYKKLALFLSINLIINSYTTVENLELINKMEIMKQYYKNKKVLVTGGCGFIGSHLVKKLVTYGAKVTVLDDLSTGSLENIKPWLCKITFIQGSITDPSICQQAAHGATHVFHLAACTSVAQSMEDPRQCHEINVNGTFNILEAASAAGVTRFIFSSSAAVYGVSEGICSENSDCRPVSPYGSSKLIGEQLCQQWRQSHGLEAISLRYFNVFGSRQNSCGQYAAVVATFIERMRTNQQITLYGDGLQTRDFIPVTQVVNANLLIGMAPNELLDQQVFNVATGNSITLLSLIAHLKKSYPNYTHEPAFLPARPGDIKHSSADCTRINRLYQKVLAAY